VLCDLGRRVNVAQIDDNGLRHHVLEAGKIERAERSPDGDSRETENVAYPRLLLFTLALRTRSNRMFALFSEMKKGRLKWRPFLPGTGETGLWIEGARLDPRVASRGVC
jgi:hypothetical protein